MNADGHILLYEQTILDSVQYAVLLEEAIGKELFEINGTIGMYRIMEEDLVMVWTDNNYAYKITGSIDVEQALDMAHSTK